MENLSKNNASYASQKIKIPRDSDRFDTHLSGVPIKGKGKPQSIADFNEFRGRNYLLQMTQKPKLFYGYKEPKIYPKVTGVIGSALNTNVGTDRARGACKWGGRSAFYAYPDAKQKPIFRNKDNRLQFPHFQQMVCDYIQNPPKMYGEFSQKVSKNLVL
jgi:hypothetical protein